MERYRYDAYGAATVLDPDGTDDSDGLSDVENPYLFTARRLDLESDLMYYRNRQYSVVLGRFISRDPQGYTEFLSLYCYVGGRPMWAADPLGNTPCSWAPEFSFSGTSSVEHYYGKPTLLRAEYGYYTEIKLPSYRPPGTPIECLGDMGRLRAWKIHSIRCYWVRAVIYTSRVKGTVTVDFRNVCWRPWFLSTISFNVDWEYSSGYSEGPKHTDYVHNDPDNPIIVWAAPVQFEWWKCVKEEHKALCEPPPDWRAVGWSGEPTLLPPDRSDGLSGGG